MGGQPGDSIPGHILVFKSLLELFEKIIAGSKGYSGASDGILLEGIGASRGRPFGHIQEGKANFLRIVAVGCLVDCEVELDGVHPGDSHFIGAIEGFGFAELEFGRFDSSR